MLLEDFKNNRPETQLTLNHLFIELPQLFDLINAAILFDYTDKMKLTWEEEHKFTSLEEMMLIEQSTETETNEYDLYSNFLQKIIGIVRCFNNLIADMGSKENVVPQEFYGSIKRDYLRELKSKDIIQVVHW